MDTVKSKTLLYMRIMYIKSCYISHISNTHNSIKMASNTLGIQRTYLCIEKQRQERMERTHPYFGSIQNTYATHCRPQEPLHMHKQNMAHASRHSPDRESKNTMKKTNIFYVHFPHAQFYGPSIIAYTWAEFRHLTR